MLNSKLAPRQFGCKAYLFQSNSWEVPFTQPNRPIVEMHFHIPLLNFEEVRCSCQRKMLSSLSQTVNLPYFSSAHSRFLWTERWSMTTRKAESSFSLLQAANPSCPLCICNKVWISEYSSKPVGGFFSCPFHGMQIVLKIHSGMSYDFGHHLCLCCFNLF